MIRQHSQNLRPPEPKPPSNNIMALKLQEALARKSNINRGE